jgi:hypothetical protein
MDDSTELTEKGEGEVTNLIGTSPWSRRRQDGQAMVVKAAAGRAPMHKGVGQGAGEGEGSAGDPFQASMKVGRWRKSQAVMVKAVAGRTLMRVRSGLRIGARRSGGEVVRGGDAGVTFYRVGGGAGRPGDGGEWAAVVGRHDGGGGGRFDRGSPGVVGSDEGVPWPFRERKGGLQEAASPHTQGGGGGVGRSTWVGRWPSRGPCVGERGWGRLAGPAKG